MLVNLVFPLPTEPMRYLINFLNVFLGTVRRAEWTFGGGATIYLALHPALAAELIRLVLTIGIIYIAYRIFIQKVFGGVRKKSSST